MVINGICYFQVFSYLILCKSVINCFFSLPSTSVIKLNYFRNFLWNAVMLCSSCSHWPLSVLCKDTHRQERFPSCRSHWLSFEDGISHLWLCWHREKKEAVMVNVVSYSTAFPAFHRTLAYSSFITFCKIFSSNQLESKNYCKFFTDI